MGQKVAHSVGLGAELSIISNYKSFLKAGGAILLLIFCSQIINSIVGTKSAKLMIANITQHQSNPEVLPRGIA
jgi:hypothetical protein